MACSTRLNSTSVFPFLIYVMAFSVCGTFFICGTCRKVLDFEGHDTVAASEINTCSFKDFLRSEGSM